MHHKKSHRHISKTIKTLVVFDSKDIIKIGDIIIPSPVGVSIDRETGRVITSIHFEPINEPQFQPLILHDLLVNQGVVHAKMIIDNPDPIPCSEMKQNITKEIFIPVQNTTKIKGIKPGDIVQEKISILLFSVFGVPIPNKPDCIGQISNLIVKVILKAKVLILRNDLVKIPRRY